MTLRTAAYWTWFVIGTAALARLWSTIDNGGLFVRFGPADAVALAALLISGFVLGRVQYRTARAASDASARPTRDDETEGGT